MRYLLLLVSLLAVAACSLGEKSPPPTEPPASTRTPVPTWTPTPLLATPTNVVFPIAPTSVPKSTPASLTIGQVESLVGLSFKDQPSKDGPIRLGTYLSSNGGIIMVTLAHDLSYFAVGWMNIGPNDQDAQNEFTEILRTLSTLLLNTNTSTEAIEFVNTCIEGSVIPAVLQVKDAECWTTLNSMVTIAVRYLHKEDTLAVYMKPWVSP